MTSRDMFDIALYLLPIVFIVLLVFGWRRTWQFMRLGNYPKALAASLIQTTIFTLVAFAVLTRTVFGLTAFAFLFIGPVLLDWILVKKLVTQNKKLLAFLISLLPMSLLVAFFVQDIWNAEQLLACSCAAPNSVLLNENGSLCTFDAGTCMWGGIATKMQTFYYSVISVVGFVVTSFVTVRKWRYLQVPRTAIGINAIHP